MKTSILLFRQTHVIRLEGKLDPFCRRHSGYQIAALGVAALGLWGFVRRRNYLLNQPTAGV